VDEDKAAETVQLRQICDRNEQALTFLTCSLHLHAVEIQKALTMSLFDQNQQSNVAESTPNPLRSNANQSKSSATAKIDKLKSIDRVKVLNPKLIDSFSCDDCDSNSTHDLPDQVQSICIQRICEAVKGFLNNLSRIVYIDQSNQLTVGKPFILNNESFHLFQLVESLMTTFQLSDEIVFGRILPYMWSECNHRRRQARVRIHLNYIEQLSRHSLCLAFETNYRMLMNLSAILLVVSIDYLFLMESPEKISADINALVAKINELTRKAFIYADALIQRDRMMSHFRSNAGAHSASCITEYTAILDDNQPIVSELHAQFLLGYCIKLHYDHFVGCEMMTVPMLESSKSTLPKKVQSNVIQRLWGRKSTEKSNQSSQPLPSTLISLNSAFGRSINVQPTLKSRLSCDASTKHSHQKPNSTSIQAIQQYGRQLSDQQLILWLSQSAVHLQELVLFGSARSCAPPIIHLGRWNKLVENDQVSDPSIQPTVDQSNVPSDGPLSRQAELDEGPTKLPSYFRRLTKRLKVQCGSKLFPALKRKLVRQRQALVEQALVLNQKERELRMLNFKISRSKQLSNPWHWIGIKSNEIQRKSALGFKLKHLFDHHWLPVQCFVLKAPKQTDPIQLDGTSSPSIKSANAQKLNQTPIWEQQVQQLISCNGFRNNSIVMLQALPNQSQFWENDSQVLGQMLQQFALQVLIKDTLASNKKWRDLDPMKTLPPKRHLIANLLQLFDCDPPKLDRDCLVSSQSIALSIRLFWIELIDLSDQVLRSLFPIDWLDQQLLAVESDDLNALQKDYYIQLESSARRSTYKCRAFHNWLNDCPLLAQKTVTRRIITYEKCMSHI
jgi:hypothetical protein